MNIVDGEVYNTSDKEDREVDPYEQFLNKFVKVTPNKGGSFGAWLIKITADTFTFEGRRGMTSVYRRDGIRSIFWDGVA